MVGSVYYYGLVGLQIIIILGLALPPAGGAQGDCQLRLVGIAREHDIDDI